MLEGCIRGWNVFPGYSNQKNPAYRTCAVFVAKGTLCADVLFGNGQKVHEYDATGAPHPVIGGNKQCLPLVVDHFMDYW